MSRTTLFTILTTATHICIAASACLAQTPSPRLITPTSQKLPTAFADGGNFGIRMSVSPDGRFFLASTPREAKAWELPAGRLIYSYQQNRDGKGTVLTSSNIYGFWISADSRYIFPTRTESLGAGVLEVYDVAAGKVLGAGALLDSFKSGAWQVAHEPSVVPNAESGGPASLSVRRDFDNGGRDEGVTVLSASADAAHPGERLIVYKQQYCGSKDWIKATGRYTVKELRRLQQERNHCQYEDYHVARQAMATGKVTYLGPLRPGVEGVDYNAIKATLPAPSGEAIYVLSYETDGSKRIAFYNTAGGERWGLDGMDVSTTFEGFDADGNAIIQDFNNDLTKTITLRRGLTGEVLEAYKLPAGGEKRAALIPRWGMCAVAVTAGGFYTIGLYNTADGKYMLPLTDEAGATRFASEYRAEAEAAAAQAAANIRANEQAWENHLRQQALLDDAFRKKTLAAAQEHAKHFMTCPKCEGIGYFTKSGYSRGSSSSTEGVRQNTITGEKTLVRTTTTTAGGAYSTYEVCPRCQGRREVPKY